MSCAPQRFLAGNRNAIYAAVLSASSILAKANSVFPVPLSRAGTGRVEIGGDYSGDDDATYDFEIVDGDVETPIVSAPIFSGSGSGTLTGISADLPAQQITVELSESGLPLLAAATDFEGVTLKARAAGVAGNSIHVSIDQSPLVFAPQNYSLLNDLRAGDGGKDSPLSGSEYDFDTAILGADNAIPTGAHRISFGDDTSAIYLQYKAYADGQWRYYFVPALKRDVAKGTIVNFVTGGRTVRIYPGSPPETYPDIVTLYDLLYALKTQSALVDVDGVVANDRSPTGQAAQELQTRTDAHFLPSYGQGSEAARGFENISVATNAGTQLVVATCRAVTAADHPLATLTKERWELESSTLGVLGTVVTGVPFAGAEFDLTVPIRAPFEGTTQVGNFTVTDIAYAARADGDPDPPPICPAVGDKAGELGPAATDQTLTLIWTQRPSGDCTCTSMPVANLNTSCLGNDGLGGGDSMAYQVDTIARLKLLREWFVDIVRANSGRIDSGSNTVTAYEMSFLLDPLKDLNTPSQFKSLKAVVDEFERTLALIDPLEGGTPSYRGAGNLAWDDAFGELQDDIALFSHGGYNSSTYNLYEIPADRYLARLAAVLAAAGLSALGESDASIMASGDGCWRDTGDAYYFTVVGSTGGAYAPLFVNVPYWSSRRAADSGKYFSTHEFAMHIRVKPECVANLRVGDRFIAVIGNAARASTYQVGDKLFLPIVSAADLYLAGGQDASLVQRWLINGSVAGPFPYFAYDPDSPTSYADGTVPTLQFTLTPGGIDFEKGDRFTFSIEGGHYKWRKDGGAWHLSTPPDPIPAGGFAFDAGLSAEFITGASPSFVAGDRFSFRARQPWTVENVRTPNVARWKWSGSAPVFSAEFADPADIDAVAFAFHTIPEGAAITVEGGASVGVFDWSEEITWREGAIVHFLSVPRTAQASIRISLTGAAGGSIGWIWAGSPLATARSADSLPRPSTRFARGEGGLYQGGRFLGKGVAGDVEWTESGLTEADVAELLELFYWVKEHDDEPFIFLPQYTRADEAYAVRVASDEIEFPDVFGYQPNADRERLQQCRLALAAVYQ